MRGSFPDGASGLHPSIGAFAVLNRVLVPLESAVREAVLPVEEAD